MNKVKPFFKGWYFKIASKEHTMCFIPGFSIDSNGKKIAFVQVITPDEAFCKFYDIKEFCYSEYPFRVKVGSNEFTSSGMKISIKTKTNIIKGNVTFGRFEKLKSTAYCPNIMGPFSYLKFMECKHDVLSVNHLVNGTITVNNNNILFKDAKGYVESDCGDSFPKSWLWVQGNSFEDCNASFMFAVATIPMKLFSFNGVIGYLKTSTMEIQFGSYYGAKLVEAVRHDKGFRIKLIQGDYTVYVYATGENGLKLLSPSRGAMSKPIKEMCNGVCEVKIFDRDELIFHDTTCNSGMEFEGSM